MKFCAVLGAHPTDTPGGAELQSQFICTELSDRGHDSYYVAYDSGVETVEETDGVTVLRLDTTGRYRNARRILAEIERIDPDVLYFRIIKDLPFAAAAKLRTDAHVVFNVSHDAHCLPLFAHWPGKRDRSRSVAAYRRVKLAGLRSLLEIPDTVFVQTETQQRLLATNRNVDAVLTGNGHPVPEGEPDKHSPPAVLWLASIKPWKQPHAFLDLAESCTNLNCEFWMVGQPTHERLADEVRSRARSIPDLEYLGGCSVDESDDYIERASVFVNTSTQEGFPNTFIQSWLRKTPVVSLHVDPVGDDGDSHGPETGYYGVGDIESLAGSVRTLVDDEDHRQRIADRAYARAAEEYDIARVVDRIEAALPDSCYE